MNRRRFLAALTAAPVAGLAATQGLPRLASPTGDTLLDGMARLAKAHPDRVFLCSPQVYRRLWESLASEWHTGYHTLAVRGVPVYWHTAVPADTYYLLSRTQFQDMANHVTLRSGPQFAT